MKQVIIIVVWVLISIGAAEAGQKELSDGNIIAIYNQVNSFDIESALMAVTKAKSKNVINLAKQVSNDHRGVRLAASNLADAVKSKVSLPDLRQEAARQHYMKMSELSMLDAEAFDREYLLHEIQFHTEAISAVREILIPNTQNKEIVKHFKSVLPHFEHHLSESKRVAEELGYY